MQYLTPERRDNLSAVLDAVSKSPRVENTPESIQDRTGLAEETVLWALDVLHNYGYGWVDYTDHPKLPIRVYFTNKHHQKGVGSLDDLYAGWLQRRQADEILIFDYDDDDPDDEWSEGTYEE